MAYDDSQDNGAGGGGDFGSGLNTLYQKYYGRDASADELNAHKGNPGGLGAVEKMLQTSQAGAGPGTSAPGAKSAGMPDGIDPRLAALYTKAGMTPGGSGTGFSDWQYWQGKMNSGDRDAQYYLDRLGADLNGTGTDQPTGTLGQGAWNKSGAGQPEAGGGGGQLPAPPPQMQSPGLPSPQTGYGPSMNTPNNFWQGRSAQDLANSASGIGSGGSSSSSNDPTGIIAALMKRIGLNTAGIQFNKG